MDYQVKVENFEGPMDLLLFFIQRDKLNIYDIPIAHITKEFLDYMKLMDMMNIDLGGEFVYMASLLMKIKAKMLLPVLDEDVEQIEDPRTPLVQRLLEYQQYKKVGEQLQGIYTDHAVHFSLGQDMAYDAGSEKNINPVQNVTLFTLSSIFQELINRLPDVNPYELREEPIQLDEQIAFLIGEINSTKRLSFTILIPILKTRLRIVVTFMAILEMLRTNQIAIEQNEPFGGINTNESCSLMNYRHLVEVLLFASPEPLTQARFNHIIQDENTVELVPIIDELSNEYEKTGKGLIIKKIGGGFQILSHADYHIYIERMFTNTRKLQLSRPALEALSIIAYRQPVSKAEVESIRGVECGSVVNTLMERELITVKGRGKTVGRPLLFGTTQIFLESFGLENTADLPKLKELSELMGDNPDPVLFENDHATE